MKVSSLCDKLLPASLNNREILEIFVAHQQSVDDYAKDGGQGGGPTFM